MESNNKKLNDDKYCFACGSLNPIGLKMKVTYNDDKAVSRLVLDRQFQGWENIIHGGILATILDEIMAHAVWHYVGKAVTTQIQATYRAPLHIGEEIEVTGYVTEQNKRMTYAKAEIRLAQNNDKLLATAESTFVMLD